MTNHEQFNEEGQASAEGAIILFICLIVVLILANQLRVEFTDALAPVVELTATPLPTPTVIFDGTALKQFAQSAGVEQIKAAIHIDELANIRAMLNIPERMENVKGLMK